jgi:CO/xanthine dehydrogenase Mo-binding subunit
LSTRWPRPPAKTRIAFAARSWPTDRATGRCSIWQRRKRAGASRCPRAAAAAEAFKSYVAQVAKVTVDGDGKVEVDRVVCVVDCGVAVNRDVIAAQMEGGIGFGLGAALYGAITLKDGKVDQ